MNRAERSELYLTTQNGFIQSNPIKLLSQMDFLTLFRVLGQSTMLLGDVKVTIHLESETEDKKDVHTYMSQYIGFSTALELIEDGGDFDEVVSAMETAGFEVVPLKEYPYYSLGLRW